jgi:deazaflavin-dependent oxidoreductase (nitroreductase family)
VAKRYVVPDAFTRRVVNPLVIGLTRLGISVAGSRVLEVRGRRSGEPRRTPVNLLTVEGGRYLVAPRGETQWVRNLRAAGDGELRVGKRTEAFRARELDGAEQLPVLRAYLKRWKFEVGVFFGGVGPDATDEELAAIGSRHPTFEVLSGPGPSAHG